MSIHVFSFSEFLFTISKYSGNISIEGGIDMTFGKRLKKARNEKNMTQRELANLLSVKHNSISNWENDINKPDPDTIELICGILEITPNYLLATSSEDFSPAEKLVIKRYRALDPHGKEMVDIVLQKEYERSMTEKEPEKIVPISTLAEDSPYTVNAAHERTDISPSAEDQKHDDDIMDKEEF